MAMSTIQGDGAWTVASLWQGDNIWSLGGRALVLHSVEVLMYGNVMQILSEIIGNSIYRASTIT